jgi:cytochrome P450
LAKYPHWQQAVREEVQAVAGSSIDYEQLESLELTERVLKEALRFRPPVPFIPRQAVQPFEYGGFSLPADTNVTVFPGAVAMDVGIWTDPESFDPDRFSDNRAEDKKHRFAWSPFGGGAHKCIGMHFAIMQVRAFCHQFLQQFDVALAPGYEPRWQAIPIPKPKDGLEIILKRR